VCFAWPRAVSKKGVFPVCCPAPRAPRAPSDASMAALPLPRGAVSHRHPLPRLFQCYLACHKKCLETLAIQCGHKKLQGKLQLFGQDFTKASQSSSDGIPFIIKKCVSEIEKRALKTKVTRTLFPLLQLSWLGCLLRKRPASARRPAGAVFRLLEGGSQKVPGDKRGPDTPNSDRGNSLLLPPSFLRSRNGRHV